MVRKLELYSNDGKTGIRLIVSSNSNWCKIEYINHESTINLGADIFSIIKSKMLKALDFNLKEEVFTYNGICMFWILSLAEEHASINGKWLGTQFSLYIIEDGGNLLPTIELSLNEVRRWRERLLCFDESINHEF